LSELRSERAHVPNTVATAPLEGHCGNS
jgi:hypothetical protein